MGDVGKFVQDRANEVSNAVKTVGQVLAAPAKTVGIGGDVGKAMDAVAQPVGGSVESWGDLLKGDIRGAHARQTGAFLNLLSPLSNASSTFNEWERSDGVNNATLGFSNDVAQVNDAGNRMVETGDWTDQDSSAMGRLYARGAIAALTYGAAEGLAGGEGLGGSEALNSANSGWGFLKEGVGAGGAAAAFLKDPKSAALNYLGVDPALLNDAEDLYNLADSILKNPTGGKTGTTTAPSNTYISTGTGNTNYILLIGGLIAALGSLFLILKKKGK